MLLVAPTDLFSRVLFSFLPLLLATPLPLLFSAHFRLFSPSKSALFCRAKGTVQSLERGSSGMDLSTKFGKEIPSRNLREKRSAKFWPSGSGNEQMLLFSCKFAPLCVIFGLTTIAKEHWKTMFWLNGTMRWHDCTQERASRCSGSGWHCMSNCQLT